jgi:prepilin-type N-terminal cleavage/methylation domain-containing protein/prepilin-type processing-associated H-X9-DG protein
MEIAQWSSCGDTRRARIVDLASQRRASDKRRTVAAGPADSHPRPGMTLVELLVVSAVIGMLASLLLPAVQAVREAARQASCKNNLHQIGIALHAYHDLHRTLPTGCIEWRGWSSPPTRRQFAWSALILPQLEQGNLHSQIDFGLPFDAPENAAAAAKRVSVYECPTALERDLERGRTDYGGLYGQRITDRDPSDGLFLYERSIAFRQISDGLTNTLAIGEDVGGPNSEWINGRNVFVQAHGINDPAAWIGDNEIRSKHAGGAMVLFADGRTTLLSESLDKQVLGKLITRAKGEVISSSSY